LSFLKDITDCIAILKDENGLDVFNEINIPEEDKYVSHTINHDTYNRAYISESYYYKQSDAPVKTILNAIQKNEKIDLDYLNESEGTSHVKLREDVKEFEGFLEVNKEIVSKCEMYIPKVEYTLPKFTNDSSEELLKEELKVALNKKIKNITSDYTNRLNKEYTTIVEMGYADYFLIVSDLVRYSKNNDIYVGPGRGSSGASLVAYLLDITDIDHHPNVEPYGDINIVEPSVSSTSELIYILLSLVDSHPIDKTVRSLVYLGIIGDTGRFLYNSHPSTYEVMSDIARGEVDTNGLLMKLYKKSLEDFKFSGFLI